MHEGKLEACFVAFASGWNAGDKQGKTLAQLHNPVADSEILRKASDNIMRAMTSKVRLIHCLHPLHNRSHSTAQTSPRIRSLPAIRRTRRSSRLRRISREFPV